ncbi:MAG TPA: AMP-binding protein [Salinarimonas sp.]|nr:AMP-binding protein [Salinarimonas sp.]
MRALARAALARVVESKMRAEIAAAAGRHGSGTPSRRLPPGPWPEALGVGEGAPEESLGCDSLERLWLAAALAETFDLAEAAQALNEAATFGDWLDRIEAAWPGDRVTFLTSGSSGVPKPCAHAMADLALEIEGLAPLLPGRRRVVAGVPAHHIYGFLFTAMLPERLGLPVVAYGSAPLAPGDLVVSFPDHWRLVARSHPAFPPDVTGVTSTAPCPRELMDDLSARGIAAFVEVYGSSETAGLGTRFYPAPAYRLMPQWRFDDGAEADRPSLVHASGRRVGAMDRLARVGERAFMVEGRLDGMVQVGGVNVDPGAVAARLREHTLVADAAVRLMRPDEGTRLKAFVVLAPGTPEETAREDLRAWIAGALPAPARPASLAFGPALPVGAMGKAADW